MSPTIHPSTLRFLKALAAHNDRTWFSEHQEAYGAARTNVISFVDALIARMREHDQLDTWSGKSSLYRINNDLRFSADKSPYQPRFAGYLRRAKPLLRGGYYWWIKPGASRVSCGFAHPDPADLLRIRLDIRDQHDVWQRLLRNAAIRRHFGTMQGDKVKTTPRGFDADDPAIALLRYRQFWFTRSFTDAEVLAPDFLTQVNKTFRSIRPFFDHVSEVLTTDLNGEPRVTPRS